MNQAKPLNIPIEQQTFLEINKNLIEKVGGIEGILGFVRQFVSLRILDISYTNYDVQFNQTDNFLRNLNNRTVQNDDFKWIENIIQETATLEVLSLENVLVERTMSIRSLGRICDVMIKSKSIAAIYLSYSNNIGIEGTRIIANGLLVNNCLKILDLRENNIQDEGVRLIAEAIKVNLCLETLIIRNNFISYTGAKYLARALETNSCIEYVDLSGNSAVKDLGAKWIARALMMNRSLRTLIISGNEIGNEGIVHISEACKSNSSLITIILSGNKIGDTGIEDFCKCLAINSSLKFIDLSVNEIKDTGVGLIGRALLKNQVIQSLNLSSNKFGIPLSVSDRISNFFGMIGKGLSMLIDSIKANSSLMEVNLGYNELDSTSLSFFLDILKHNTILKNIDLTGNNMRVSEFVQIRSLLDGNHKLQNSLNRLHLCAFLLKFTMTD
jgi:Ran GTPase-activating protein (RanGAP) involved in mRNA processing and transport